MTIDELGTQMKQIDPNLELYFYKDYKVPDHISYEEDGVEHVLYEFLKNKFDKYECSKTIDPFQFIKLQNLISYFFDDTYSQTISKEKNGSTMPFEDDISNDSQKKTKEHLIHDFIKDAALMGFQCSPNQFYDAQTADIDVFDGESKYIMDICFLRGVRTFMVDDMEIDDLKRYSWLFTRVSTLISEWRKNEDGK